MICVPITTSPNSIEYLKLYGSKNYIKIHFNIVFFNHGFCHSNNEKTKKRKSIFNLMQFNTLFLTWYL